MRYAHPAYSEFVEATEQVGAVIRLYRQQRGLKQADLGKACGYSQPQISRLERGLASYDPHTLRKVAQVLDIPVHLLGLVDQIPVNRRDFIGAVAAFATAPVLPAVPPDVVPYFSEQLAGHWRADRALGPHLLIDTVVPQCKTVLRTVDATKGGLHRDLLRLAVSYTGLAGWLYQDAGYLDACARWLAETLELAHRSNDAELVAYALTCKAMVCADRGDGIGTVDLAEAALAAAPEHSAKPRAMAVQQAAYGHALMGDRASVDRRLDELHVLLETVERDRPWGGDRLTQSPELIVERHRATCYGELGLSAEAAAIWEQTGLPDEHRDAGVYLARHATALADIGNPEKAAALAAEGVTYLHETGSARMRREYVRLGHKAGADRRLSEVLRAIA